MVVDIDAFALQNSFEVNYEPDAGQTVALLNIGASVMNINIIRGGVPLFTRDVSVGGNQYTDALQKELDLNFDDAERLKKGETLASVSEDQRAQILRSVSDILTLEIQKLDVAGWVVTGYFVSYAISMTFMGKVSDIAGRRLVYLLCLAIFFVLSACELFPLVRAVERRRQDAGDAVGNPDAGPSEGELHHVSGEITGRVRQGLVVGGNSEAGRVIVSAKMRGGAAPGGCLEQARKIRFAAFVQNRLGGLDHQLEPD